MSRSIFVGGIGTDVGKTLASAILSTALSRDYWKPIQSGSLDYTDSDYLSSLSPSIRTHPETYQLSAALSPHAAAEIDGIKISLDKIKKPETPNSLIIEGAGGLLVPLNEKDLVIDLIEKLDVPVLLVSKNYLGSINHTLLSIEALKTRDIPIIGVLFNGEENIQSESIIIKNSKIPHLGRIPLASRIDTDFVKKQATALTPKLAELGLYPNEC